MVNLLKEVKYLIKVSREEADYLRQHGAYVARTCRDKNNGSKRGICYATEDKRTMSLLREFEKTHKVIETYPAK